MDVFHASKYRYNFLNNVCALAGLKVGFTAAVMPLLA